MLCVFVFLFLTRTLHAPSNGEPSSSSFSTFSFSISSSDKEDRANQIRKLLEKFDLEKPATHEEYRKIEDKKNCANNPLESYRGISFSDCKSKCDADDDCEYMAYFVRTKPKRCEIYIACIGTVEDESSLWKKVTPCDKSIEVYPSAIVAEFDENILRYEPPNRNFFCYCMQKRWMFCAAFVPSNGKEHQNLISRFYAPEIEDRKPFEIKTFPGDIQSRILYAPAPFKKMFNAAVGEIAVWESSRCLHVSVCSEGTPGGVCPVLKFPFMSGMAVYVLNDDVDLIHESRPVPCMTMQGAFALTFAGINFQFVDPLGRRPGELLSRQGDYRPYFLFDDATIATSVVWRLKCRGPPTKEALPIIRTSPSTVAASSAASDSSHRDSPSDELEKIPDNPQAGPKKKNRSKKKKASAGQDRDSSNSPYGSPPGPAMLSPLGMRQQESTDSLDSGEMHVSSTYAFYFHTSFLFLFPLLGIFVAYLLFRFIAYISTPNDVYIEFSHYSDECT